jgi:hypothetical protein
MRGAIAIMVGICILAMIAFLGVVIDLGRMYTIKTELSNAADACALAAASELRGDADSLIRADNAADMTTQRNLADFQRTTVSFIQNSTVTFSDHLEPIANYKTRTAVVPADIPNMHYARCLLPRSGILPWFMQVMGFGTQAVASHAIASLYNSQTSCALPIALIQLPTGTCPDGSATDAYGFCIGQWYGGIRSAGGDDLSGNFNWVDFTPPNGGASELSDLLTGDGWCSTATGMQVGESGMNESVAKAWNTRFGIYPGNGCNGNGPTNIENTPPDSTGFAYTPTSCTQQFNAFSGTCTTSGGAASPNFETAEGNNTSYQGDAASGISGIEQGTCTSTSAQLAAEGASYRRVALMPIVPSNAWVGSQTATLLDYGCVLMLEPMGGPGSTTYVEYRGLASQPGNLCPVNGLSGGGGPLVPTLVR